MNDDALLQRIEALVVRLAAEGGAFATSQLDREILVEYKADARGVEQASDPVSEVDHAVEALLRERVGDEFPDHVIMGEEVEVHPGPETEYVWVVDPVDGTTNFVNGFPLFAVSIGVLRHGRPIVGAVWCATTHALNPGVYHACEGGPLSLDGRPVTTERATRVRRSLAAAPGGSPAGTPLWEHRVTGSIALESAYVAAGVFAAAPFWGPRIWDVAGGIPLIRASGREIWIRRGQEWTPFERFEVPGRLPGDVRDGRQPSLRDWRGSLVVGTPEGTRAIRERAARRPWWQRWQGRRR